MAISTIGRLWRDEVEKAAAPYTNIIDRVEGEQLLSSIIFHDRDIANKFAHILSDDMSVDVSVQTYKPDCPKAALLKLPLITSENSVRFIAAKVAEALKEAAK